MALARLDETGLHLPDYPAVLAYVQDRLRDIYGEDLYLEPDSQDGQMAAIFAGAIHDAFALTASVYNAFAPGTAQGESLSRQVAINGLRRQTATFSTASLRVVGAVGTVLRGAVAMDTAERRWRLPDTVIPLSGEAVVTATAEAPGAIAAPAGDIARIATPILGWHAVSNPEPATPGRDVESDAALRRRQTRSTALPSRTVFEGVLGAVAAVPGVARLRGYENDGPGADSHGIPGHAIAVVVEGGDDQAIAETIAAKKTPGCGTFGTTAVPVRDRYGVPVTIAFFRPTSVPIAALIRIRPLPGYLSTTGAAIRAAAAAALNALGIGEDVLISRLYAPITATDPAPGQRTFDVLSIEAAADGGTLQAANIAIAFNAAVQAADADMVVEIDP